MPLSNLLTATVLGVMSLSGAAARDLAQAKKPGHICEKNPNIPGCKDDGPGNSGAAAASSGGNDHDDASPPVNVSLAQCTAVAWGYSEATNEDQSAQAAADAHAFICGNGFAEAHAIAQASARAFARAVADASVHGYVEGDASCWANAGAAAEAQAEVWLEAYAQAFASSADCQHCDAFADAWAYISQHVFLDALATASASLDLYANGGNIGAYVHDYASDIEEAIVSAYADALAGTATYYDTNACWAWVGVGGCIVSETNPTGACAACQADAVGDTFIQEIDAIATASAHAAAEACGSVVLSYASVSASAKAIAEALAVATAQSYASCAADEGGYACADAGSYASDTAKAVAKAFATAWAGAISCGPDCYVNIDDASEKIGKVLVTATASAYSAVCAGDGSSWTAHDFQQHIEHEHLAAIAEACALALALDVGNGGFCLAAVSADTYLH